MSTETYQHLVHRLNHRPRLANGIRTFPGFQISRLVHGGQFQFETSGMGGHFLCFPFAEGARLAYRQERFRQEGTILPGQITLLPAGREAVWIAETPPVVNTINLYLAPEIVSDVAHCSEISLRRPPWFMDTHLFRLAELLGEEVDADCPNGTLYAETLVRAIAVRLAQNYADTPLRTPPARPGRTEVRQVKEILLSNLSTDHSLERLASLLCLSPSHLSRLFRAETGQSIYAFLLEARLEAAHALLCNRQANVSEAATTCGFYDAAHLARHFHRRYGCSPRKLFPG